VRVIGSDGGQLGVLSLPDALTMARTEGLDLVEIAPTARPPVCRIVDYGKFRYEQSKKEKETRKHQHANRVKEIQLRPSTDPHDFEFKVNHAVDFLCEDMKVKVSLRFRGRENAHREIGFQVIEKFIQDLASFGTPDFQPKLVGRGLTVMISPLPRTKRAPNPRQTKSEGDADEEARDNHEAPEEKSSRSQAKEGFSNNPFSSLDARESG
jgi:translation initiation factor IF-3